MFKKDPKDLSTIPAQFFVRKQQTDPNSLLLSDKEELQHYRSVLGNVAKLLIKATFLNYLSDSWEELNDKEQQIDKLPFFYQEKLKSGFLKKVPKSNQ